VFSESKDDADSNRMIEKEVESRWKLELRHNKDTFELSTIISM